jgi:hypothetical protein
MMKACYQLPHYLFFASLLLLSIFIPGRAQTSLAARNPGERIHEKQIEQALAEPGSFDFVETPLHETVAMISRRFGPQIRALAR